MNLNRCETLVVIGVKRYKTPFDAKIYYIDLDGGVNGGNMAL